MRRLYGKARTAWQTEIEQQGIVYNRTDLPDGEAVSYWREDVSYDFDAQEIGVLEGAASQLFAACVEAGDRICYDRSDRLMDKLAIPPAWRDVVRRDWDAEPPSVYGRFDVAWGGLYDETGAVVASDPKLLEFNADTPTSLVESAVVQWSWLLENPSAAGCDQWNRLHEALVDAWKRNLSRWQAQTGRPKPVVHLAHTSADESGEDHMTVAYMADTVMAAGYGVKILTVEEIVHDPATNRFFDRDDKHLDVVFALYPWEWMPDQRFGPAVLENLRTDAGGTTWVEPVWKMLWSNKGLLPVLWELYEDDSEVGKLLLPAYFEDDPRCAELDARGYARKPLLGREGANVRLVGPTGTLYAGDTAVGPANLTLADVGGQYGAEGYVRQALHKLPDFAGPDGPHHPVLGLWMVDGEPAGMGIRESTGLVTDNLSHFAPHTIGRR